MDLVIFCLPLSEHNAPWIPSPNENERISLFFFLFCSQWLYIVWRALQHPPKVTAANRRMTWSREEVVKKYPLQAETHEMLMNKKRSWWAGVGSLIPMNMSKRYCPPRVLAKKKKRKNEKKYFRFPSQGFACLKFLLHGNRWRISSHLDLFALFLQTKSIFRPTLSLLFFAPKKRTIDEGM